MPCFRHDGLSVFELVEDGLWYVEVDLREVSGFVGLCVADGSGLVVEVEVAAIVAEPDYIHVLEVLPRPVHAGEFAVGFVFDRDVVAGVVCLYAEVEFGMEILAYMYGHVGCLRGHDVLLMAADEDCCGFGHVDMVGLCHSFQLLGGGYIGSAIPVLSSSLHEMFSLIILAGVPTAIQCGAIFFVTIEPSPITQPSPTETPFITTAEAPSHT